MNINLILFIVFLLPTLFFGRRFLIERGFTFTPKISTPIGEFSKKSLPTSPKINSFILYSSGKIEIVNRGDQDFYINGTQFDSEEKSIDIKRVIPSKFSYYLNTDLLFRWIKTNLKDNDMRLVPFNIFLTDLNNSKYIMKNNLLIKVVNGEISIQPQTLSLQQEI